MNRITQLSTKRYKTLVLSRLLAENILLLLLQLMGMKFCLFSSTPLPINFAAGTAAAFIFMRGYTILPGIWLGSVIAGITGGLTFTQSSLLACAYTLQTGLLFWLCLRYVSPGLIFLERKLFLRFALLCVSLALVFSPIITAWYANLAGLIIVTLAITHWDMYFPELHEWRSIPNLPVIACLFFIALATNLLASISELTGIPPNLLNYISLSLPSLGTILIFCGIRQANME